jgi:Leucine-rich repeat (LRR) protein
MDVHFNFLTGVLPDLSALTGLTYFSAANNDLTGSIPQSWNKLHQLTTLGLAHNRLTGSISVANNTYMPEMEVLYVRNNSLNGSVPLFSKKVAVLDLDQNQFTDLTDEFIKHGAGMVALSHNGSGCGIDWPVQPFATACFAQNPWGYERANKTAGSFVPKDNSSMCDTSKDWLQMQEAHAFGFRCPCRGASKLLPYEECMAWQQFAEDTLGHRQINPDNSSWATFEKYCSHTDTFLDPCGCHFIKNDDDDYGGGWPDYDDDAYGIRCINQPPTHNVVHKITTDIAIWGALPEFAPSNNTRQIVVSGTLPRDFAKLSHLRRLNLGGNPQLTGTVVAQLQGLNHLQQLQLYNTGLTGTISSGIGDLPGLKFLDLGCNHLTGTIPPEMAKITNLRYLKLGGNALSGRVPSLNYLNMRMGCCLSWPANAVRIKGCKDRSNFGDGSIINTTCEHCQVGNWGCDPKGGNWNPGQSC